MRRVERSFRAGLQVVEARDREALARGRAITRPMAAEVLVREGLGDGEGDDDDPAT